MLLFNKSLSKLAISLILRRFFQQSRRIFPDLPMKKVEKKKKPWKGRFICSTWLSLAI